jgi:hypothetical protein
MVNGRICSKLISINLALIYLLKSNFLILYPPPLKISIPYNREVIASYNLAYLEL